MAVKPNAQICAIKEQIIEDPLTGLTIQFAVMPDDAECPVRIKIFGPLPMGNRELMFSPSGEWNGTGTAVGGACKPSWLREVR